MNPTRFFAALMELIKILFLASYYFLAIGRPMPSIPYALSLLAALGISRASRGGGMRAAVYVLLNAAVLALSSFAAWAIFLGSPFDPRVLFPRDSGELFINLSVLAWSVVFWLRGEWLGREKPDHPFCVARFDEGLAMFLLALFAAAVVRASNSFAENLFLPFFLFGILALGSSKQNSARAGGLARSAGKNGIIRVVAVFVLVSIALLLLIPALLEPARRAGNSIQRALAAMEPGFVAFLRWIFGFRPPAPLAADASSGGNAISPTSAEDIGIVGHVLAGIITWFLIALAAAAILILLTFALAALVRSLSKRVKKDGEGLSLFPVWLQTILRRLARLFSRVKVQILHRREPRSAASSAYARFLRSGRAAGFARRRNETPREYASRLILVFPHSAEQAPFVVEALEKEYYGGQTLDSRTERSLITIRRKTRMFSFQAERLGLVLRHHP